MKNKFGFDSSRHPHSFFWKRPAIGRRMFFRHVASAVGGYFLLPAKPFERVAKAAATPKNTAKNVIFVLMAGAPSHTDTFDLKVGPWTPASFNPTPYNKVMFPQGLMPNLASQLSSLALLRSTRSWAAVHGLAQTWVQIGRNPTQGNSAIAPHIGAVVSDLLRSSSPDTTLPAFISLNASGGVGAGFMPPSNAPFYISPGGTGLPNSSHPDGQARFTSRYALHTDLDQMIAQSSPYGSTTDDMVAADAAARQLMYNTNVNNAFTFSAADRTRYGNTGFGNACITARNLVAANMGARFIQITVGGWDMHQNIYAANNLPTLAKQFDAGLGMLISDMQAAGTLNNTLIVAQGEFGRTVGPVNQGSGRDHLLQQSVLMAGGGISGGTVIGSTNASGDATADPGWSRQRDIHPEDIEATIYSALGIDWTSLLADPTGRGFDLVPFASEQDLYGPVNELWS